MRGSHRWCRAPAHRKGSGLRFLAALLILRRLGNPILHPAHRLGLLPDLALGVLLGQPQAGANPALLLGLLHQSPPQGTVYQTHRGCQGNHSYALTPLVTTSPQPSATSLWAMSLRFFSSSAGE